MATPVSYSCPLCRHSLPTLKLFVSHLRVLHSKDPSFSILCGVRGCREVFGAFSAFSSHIYRHHRSDMGISSLPKSSTCVLSSPEMSDPSDLSVIDESMEWQGQQQDIDFLTQDCDDPTQIPASASGQTSSSSSSEFNQTVTAAKMLLQLREGHQVSQVAISEIVSCCKSLCNQAVNELKGDIIAALNPSGQDISLVLNKDYDPFKNIDTNYLFEKFCVDHLGCLVSFACVIATAV